MYIIRNFIHLKSDVIDSSNPNEKIIRLEAAKCAFELGCMLDSMSGHLYYIMFLLVQNELEILNIAEYLRQRSSFLILSVSTSSNSSNKLGAFSSCFIKHSASLILSSLSSWNGTLYLVL
jgi:hypothetical protein